MEAKDTRASEAVQGPDEDIDTGDSSENNVYSQDIEDSLSAMDRQYAIQHSIPKRIHVLGTGGVGKMVAHSLRGIANPPPITLMLHKRSLLKAWEENRETITIEDDGTEVKRQGFEVELIPLIRRQHGVELKDGDDLYENRDYVSPHEAAKTLAAQYSLEDSQAKELRSRSSGSAGETAASENHEEPIATYEPADPAHSNEPIHNLIVTTKAPFTVSALLPIKHRLSASSTICFLQNGMGMLDTLNRELFPDAETRPNYIQGILTHGVNVPPVVAAINPFYAVHAGHGTIALGLLPRAGTEKHPSDAIRATSASNAAAESDRWAPSSRYLLRTLTRTPVLCAVGFTPTELLQQQLEKLAVNSVLNPLTTLLDARNGAILYNFPITRTLRLLLAETSLVIRSLPELKNIPNVNTRFSAQRLETLIVSVANQTRDNISSMLADVRAGRQTEIEYINGYIVRRGEEIGIKCVVNYAIMQTVIGKSGVTQREMQQSIAMEGMKDPNDSAT